MLESTFLEDWDEIGRKMAKRGHLLPKSGINSELVSNQRVNRFKLKQLDYSLSISMPNGWLGLRLRQLSRDRNLEPSVVKPKPIKSLSQPQTVVKPKLK